MLRATCHEPGTGWRTVDDLATISELTQRSGNVVWAVAEVSSLDATTVARIGEEFDLHQLAVDDAVALRQRPKLEEYEGHLFAVVHQLDTVDDQVEARQVACFIGARYVLTLHDRADRTIAEVERRSRDIPAGRGRGAEVLIHTILDTLVDDYQRIADELEHEIEDLEELVLDTPAAPVERRLYAVKQRLARYRRYVLPVGRILDRVVQPVGASALITGETAAHFRDVDDHLKRIADQVRNVEDLTNAVVEMHRSAQAQALNEVTKKLTGWAAIIAVPTFIASVYGMNFRLFPPDGGSFGFWFALAIMVIAAAFLYVYFKRRRWI